MIVETLLACAPPAALPHLPIALREDERIQVTLVERRISADAAPPISLASETLELAPEPPEGAPALPEVVHGAGWSVLHVGGRPIHVVLGRGAPEAETLELAWIDLDADGQFAAAERIALKPSARELAEGERSWSENLEGLEIRSGGSVFPVTLSYSVHPKRGTSARILFATWHEARVTVGEVEMALALLDGDHDGCYGSGEDRWFLYDAAVPPERPANAYALSAFDEGRYHAGQRYVLAPQACAQLEVALTAATGPDPRDLERHRTRIEHLWSGRFDEEREGFVSSNGLDETRARATEPIAWRYLGFEEALALSAQMERPLFVDVMAFWCVWCYRMDYYTYVDAEVAKLLNESFVPVKIIQEQAVAGDYELVRGKLEARGIPAMGIFDAEGKVLHKIGGWKKPEDFLADLEAGLAAFQGGGD